MSADNYRLVPEKVVISEPLMFTGLVEDYRAHINPNDFQDQKELELALRASEEAATTATARCRMGVSERE